MTTNDLLVKLQSWYQQQLNGEWESYYGISLETTDQGAWELSIDLRGTALASRSFETIQRGRRHDPHQAWLHCEVKFHKFIGQAHVSQLNQLVLVFLEFAQAIDD